ncbi:MAG: cysteine protease [Peltula sp. TS41687]|nr:MAG: cysteine protease [Peltula sp. TS41687]
MADLEAEAEELASGIHGESKSQQALEQSIASAELLMKALRLATSKDDRVRLNRKCKSMLDQAERIKQARKDSTADRACERGHALPNKKSAITPGLDPALSTKEKRILLESSRVNSFTFPPWESRPNAAEFELGEGEGKYTDDAVLSLSKLQTKLFDGWKRPEDGFSPLDSCGSVLRLGTDADLVQDATSDCSVVASLCALITLGEEGLSKILSSLIFPYDEDRQCPAISTNGKYMLRFYVNGCFRKVVIDDLLPASKTERALHVVDRRNPRLIWPALVEKAYLKIRGGYDFPGSNSGTDTWILIGWIPEQLFLRSPEITPDQIWRRIHSSFKHKDVLITVGTGRISSAEEAELGLASRHDYVVLKLKETEDRRMLLVKNPWSDSLIWKSKSQGNDMPKLGTNGPPESTIDVLDPGTFWIELEQVMQNFESMYLNWNPDIFPHHQDVHFTWTIEDNPSGSFRTNPQHSIVSRTGGVVWLLLSHHFQSDTELTSKPGSAFISLYAFAQAGHRVLLSDGAAHRGPYVDAPQTLLRLDLPPSTPYTIVAAQESLPHTTQRFTLSAFSLQRITLQLATDIYTHWTSHPAGWTPSTAGGNASSPTYPSNPQYSLHLSTPSLLAVLLETPDNANIPIHLKLVHSTGSDRITTVTSRSIVNDSGAYRRGCAAIEIPHTPLEPGKYTIIASSFDAGQVCKFTLHLGCSAPPHTWTLRPIPSETAGRLSLRLPPAIFGGAASSNSSGNRLAAPLHPQRMTRLRLIARTTQTPPTQSLRSLLRISIESRSFSAAGYDGVRTLVHSGEEFDGSGVLRTGDADLTPEMYRRGGGGGGGGVWVVLERMATCAAGNGGEGGEDDNGAEIVQVEMLSDERLEFGEWEVRDM